MPLLKIVSMIRNYHNHKLQTNPWHDEEEQRIINETQRRQTKQNYRLSLPIKMITKQDWTQSDAQQNIEQLQNPTMGVTIHNESTTSEPPS